jgi:hypothetical protein
MPSEQRIDEKTGRGHRGFTYTDAELKEKHKELQMVVDAVPYLTQFRVDTQSGAIAQQMVLQTLQELFRHEYAAKKWANAGLINMSTSLNEGVNEYSYVEVLHTGEAAIVSPDGTDAPAADVQGRNNMRQVHTISDFVTFTTQDIRQARMQGFFDIAQEKAVAAREAMDLKINNLIRTGEESKGLRGITNAPGITVANATTGNWTTASGAQIVADIVNAANAQISDTDEVEEPNTGVLDVASKRILTTKVHLPGSSDRTIMSFLREALPGITRWESESGMKTADAAGTGPSLLLYNNTPTRVRAVFPMMMKALAPQDHALGVRLYFESRFGGVIAPRPLSLTRVDGIGA